jgi:hypothetical protein
MPVRLGHFGHGPLELRRDVAADSEVDHAEAGVLHGIEQPAQERVLVARGVRPGVSATQDEASRDGPWPRECTGGPDTARACWSHPMARPGACPQGAGDGGGGDVTIPGRRAGWPNTGAPPSCSAGLCRLRYRKRHSPGDEHPPPRRAGRANPWGMPPLPQHSTDMPPPGPVGSRGPPARPVALRRPRGPARWSSAPIP